MAAFFGTGESKLQPADRGSNAGAVRNPGVVSVNDEVAVSVPGPRGRDFGLAFDILVVDAMGKAEWDPAHPGWAQAATVGKSLGLEWAATG